MIAFAHVEWVKITQLAIFLTHEQVDFPPLQLTIVLKPESPSGGRKGALIAATCPLRRLRRHGPHDDSGAALVACDV